ncbi:ubiquinol-cytochrome C chaperone family protein [Stappia sp. WLB 29]|uniref:ubiquinol-cytochrome C chaperone family protein n=1 Tax=Stappia sp. WLB 29 TaxID=2925220 RepID=UPI0020C10E17|nr:ubiquinol-cytochrome C chaperone family protein [Stappia sp. WLB 29]
MVFGLFRRRQRPEVLAAYTSIVAQARQPWLYARYNVPDTIDGRFEMVMLHTILVLNRLRGEGEVASDFSQRLFDTFFADMDGSLREMGVGDLGVPKKVKKMAEAFYGRAAALAEALAADGLQDLESLVNRNLFADAHDAVAAHAIARYLRGAADGLSNQDAPAIIANGPVWPDEPTDIG